MKATEVILCVMGIGMLVSVLFTLWLSWGKSKEELRSRDMTVGFYVFFIMLGWITVIALVCMSLTEAVHKLKKRYHGR